MLEKKMLGIAHGLICIVAAGLLMAMPTWTCAQTVPATGAAASAAPQRLSAQQLEDLVGRVALYPDDLLAIVLPSATTPLEVVKAQRFLDKRKQDTKLQPDASMPAPVKSLLNYPDVVKTMNDDLDWTGALGSAVTAQQKDVVDAIQAFRRKVYSAGNLKTDDKQIVVVEKETIKVVQSNPQVIYVPQYQPAQVVVVHSAPVYAYYPTPYPVYYYPYPPGAAFATGVFVGAATAYAFNWNSATINHNVDVNQLQQQRINYANTAREDRQQQINTSREDRQGQAQGNQSQRQDQSNQNQAQRQQAAADQSSQRQDSAAQRQQSAQAQRDSGQSQRQDAASQRQSAAQQPQRPDGATQRTQGAAASQQPAGKSWQASNASAGSRAQSYSGGGAAAHSSAFSGVNSGAAASRSSARGAQSRGGGRR